MSSDCLKFLDSVVEEIDNCNLLLLNNMLIEKTDLDVLCVKPNITYHFYFQSLKQKISQLVDQFEQSHKDCKISSKSFNFLVGFNQNFVLSEDAIQSAYSFGHLLVNRCQCQYYDIFKEIVMIYKDKILESYAGESKNDLNRLMEKIYQDFTNLMNQSESSLQVKKNIINNMIKKITAIYSFNLEKNLNELIPNKLGSLKDFFITLITTYYNNLHPIIWTQIFKAIVNNIFIDKPMTSEEFYGFISRHALLNSGPFILKTLQLIRPVLTDDMVRKYNIDKLKYPLMTETEVNTILTYFIPDWKMYYIMANYSASVGHVVKVYKVDDPKNVFIIKIIKPLSIAQSCWEYETLHKIFPKESCEGKFIITNLEETAEEFNVKQEYENIVKAKQFYKGTYRGLFGFNVDAKLTTIDVVNGVVRDDSWNVLAMTLAPGLPLNNIIENHDLSKDTKYRANLHRCFDLLVYKFVDNIVQNGFYHGDLHSGNIFYSYRDNQITLIDFGAVGNLNIFDKDPIVAMIMNINIMGLFYNYEGILDELTKFVNMICPETQIDTSTREYQEFRDKLNKHKYENIKLGDAEREVKDKFHDEIFGTKRLNQEKQSNQVQEKNDPFVIRTIYSLLERVPDDPEVVVENRNELPSSDFIEKDTNKVNLNSILIMIFDFYANSGINIAVKLNDFYQFNKAYSLLLGVLNKINYPTMRFNVVVKKALVKLSNLKHIVRINFVVKMLKKYLEEEAKYERDARKMKSSPNLSEESDHESDKYEDLLVTYKNKYEQELAQLEKEIKRLKMQK